jgi:arabinofuranan 3-O-arabinosyltransferase
VSERRPTVRAAGLLALLAYLPALTAAPGRMPADSKLYLYLDPGRFLGDAASSFDPNQFAGWVPHQHIAYLWPTGPWFWLFDVLGVPDWIAHRLWIGSLLVAAGLGVRWCGHLLGLSAGAALAAAVVYQTSPYVLPYVSRTSVMLLPWAGLGWIVGLTVLATRRRRWAEPAGIALVVFTVGAVNATALAMIVPGPVLWLVHTVWQRSIGWRQALLVGLRVTVLTLPVSLWWIAGLVLQGRHGAEVLPYSESLADVSLTATSTEVWRSMGYWLFYVRDPYAATTTESLRYLASTPAIALSYLVPLVGLAGLVWTQWAHRRFALLLIGAGATLAVGVHPMADRSPLMRILAGSDEGGLALALRSSTRALPLLGLGVALGAGALVTACAGIRWPRPAWSVEAGVAAAVCVVAIVNLPALWTGGFVDPALERDQDPPAGWASAVDALDASGGAGRVLQVPGAEFGAFRWGYTVDQPLPGLTGKPLVTRDLLPLGSAGAMDLLYALDDRMQDGVFESSSLAAVSRWLGVDTVWVASDLAYDRFRTARPGVIADEVAHAAGVAAGVDHGDVQPDTPAIAMVDERSIADPRATAAASPVTLHAIDDPGRVVRAGDDVVLVSGSGDGLVDLASAGVLTGDEVVRYSASLEGEALAAAAGGARTVYVTDSNRDRARHWRSSQDTLGYTESDQEELALLRDVASDQRLPVFAARDEPVDAVTQTIARQEGPVTVTATSYGEPFAYLPEHRPFAAIDGDPTTAWLVGEHADPTGEMLRLRFDAPVETIGLVQPDPATGRRITEVAVSLDGATPQRIALDGSSLTATGTPVTVGGASQVDITLTTVAGGTPFTGGAVQAVGFAEIVTGLASTVEVVRPPHDALAVTGADTPLTLAFTRLRSDPMDRWRDDAEANLVRGFDLPSSRTFGIAADVRVDARAPDAALASFFGWPAFASSRLTGSLTSAGVFAIDGDVATAWVTAFGAAEGATLTVRAVGTQVDRIAITQPEGTFSPITEVALRSAGEERVVAVPPEPVAEIVVSPPLPAGDLEVAVTGIDARTTVDRRFGDPVVLPAAVAELSVPGLLAVPDPADAAATVTCTPLIDIDGAAVAMTATLSFDDAVSGRAALAEPCTGDVDMGGGSHRVTAAEVGALPVTVDRVVLADGAAPADATDPTARVLDDGRFDRRIEVADCPDGCWLVFGEGHNAGWAADVDGASLGEPQLVDGGFNGWWLDGSDAARIVHVSWQPQGTLDLALVASALGVVAAAAVALLSRRRTTTAATTTTTDISVGHRPITFVSDAVPVPVPRVVLIALPVVWGVSAGLLIQPAWLVWGVLAGLAAGLWRRPRVPELTALATLAVVAALVTLRERRNAPTPGGGWPSVFEQWHGLGLFAAAAVVVAAVFADDASAVVDAAVVDAVDEDHDGDEA